MSSIKISQPKNHDASAAIFRRTNFMDHVKADVETKLILEHTTTSAQVHDSQVFEELLDEENQAVLADQGDLQPAGPPTDSREDPQIFYGKEFFGFQCSYF